MNDKPPSEWPSAAQVTSFMARGVGLPKSYGVSQAPAGIVYHELPPQPAPLPDNVRRARTVEQGPEPEQPAPPEAPTEVKLRAALHRANRARDFLADAELRARATYERAQKHATRCQERVESFATLDDDIVRSNIEQLNDEHHPHVELPDELRRKLIERDTARDAVKAAERAVQVLAEALVEAKADAAAAATAARRAAIRLLSLQAEASAERHDELLAEAAQFRELLAQFDRLCTGSGVALPAAVMRVLRDPKNEVNFNRVRDAGDWALALEALLTNAQAGVEEDETHVGEVEE